MYKNKTMLSSTKYPSGTGENCLNTSSYICFKYKHTHTEAIKELMYLRNIKIFSA